MFQVFRNAWKVQDIRKKILYTFLILAIFRLGSAIPVPFLNPEGLGNLLSGFSGLNLISAGALDQATLFALGIQPYINASIIMNLLQVAIPALERLSKEGDEGRRKLNKITRIAATVLALVLSIGYYFVLKSTPGVVTYTQGSAGWFSAIVIILAFTAGATLVMWLGDQVNEKGIGNGISLIIFTGIVGRAPQIASTMVEYIKLAGQGGGNQKFYILVPVAAIMFLLIIAFIVFMTKGERKIPVQYAKRVVGRKMYGGQSSHIPIKVNMSGVMPVILAGSLLSIPSLISQIFMKNSTGIFKNLLDSFSYQTIWYAILYFALIVAFNYFFTSIQYNPLQMANELRKNNGMVPGIRPGKPTADYIKRIISKITLVGALFLAAVAILPIIFSNITGLNVALGGTSVIILVGVALETAQQLESLMTMRHHKGFLE